MDTSSPDSIQALREELQAISAEITELLKEREIKRNLLRQLEKMKKEENNAE